MKAVLMTQVGTPGKRIVVTGSNPEFTISQMPNGIIISDGANLTPFSRDGKDVCLTDLKDTTVRNLVDTLDNGLRDELAKHSKIATQIVAPWLEDIFNLAN